jgi:hypothetical protein
MIVSFLFFVVEPERSGSILVRSLVEDQMFNSPPPQLLWVGKTAPRQFDDVAS